MRVQQAEQMTEYFEKKAQALAEEVKKAHTWQQKALEPLLEQTRELHDVNKAVGKDVQGIIANMLTLVTRDIEAAFAEADPSEWVQKQEPVCLKLHIAPAILESLETVLALFLRSLSGTLARCCVSHERMELDKDAAPEDAERRVLDVNAVLKKAAEAVQELGGHVTGKMEDMKAQAAAERERMEVLRTLLCIMRLLAPHPCIHPPTPIHPLTHALVHPAPINHPHACTPGKANSQRQVPKWLCTCQDMSCTLAPHVGKVCFPKVYSCRQKTMETAAKEHAIAAAHKSN